MGGRWGQSRGSEEDWGGEGVGASSGTRIFINPYPTHPRIHATKLHWCY